MKRRDGFSSFARYLFLLLVGLLSGAANSANAGGLEAKGTTARGGSEHGREVDRDRAEESARARTKSKTKLALSGRGKELPTGSVAAALRKDEKSKQAANVLKVVPPTETQNRVSAPVKLKPQDIRTLNKLSALTDPADLQRQSELLVTDPALITRVRAIAENASAKPLVLYKVSSHAIDRLPALDRTIASIRVIHGIPRDGSEAKIVHPDDLKPASDEFWSGVGKDLRETGVAQEDLRATGGAKVAAQVMERARAEGPEHELLVVLGHADDGMLRFVDGSSLSIAKLSKQAKSPIVFLSCNTLNHVKISAGMVHVANMIIATGKRIDYPEAVRMIHALQGLVSEGDSPSSLRTLLLRMQSDPRLQFLIGVTELAPWLSGPRHRWHGSVMLRNHVDFDQISA